MSRKLRVGIDIDEVLRAKWLQFDRFYSQEFGEEYTPKYVWDFFKEYPWKEVVEIEKELKEPEDMPADINPLDYQIDEKLGEAPADIFLFKKAEEKRLTAREVYNRFMYQDFVFELHASATAMYRGMDLHVNNFYFKYKDCAEFIVISQENQFSIPSTLSFLSKIRSRFSNYKFVNKFIDKWDGIDILITTDPDILKGGVPWGKKLVKLIRPYNENIGKGSLDALQINDLIDNKEFEKIIKYKNK